MTIRLTILCCVFLSFATGLAAAVLPADAIAALQAAREKLDSAAPAAHAEARAALVELSVSLTPPATSFENWTLKRTNDVVLTFDTGDLALARLRLAEVVARLCAPPVTRPELAAKVEAMHDLLHDHAPGAWIRLGALIDGTIAELAPDPSPLSLWGQQVLTPVAAAHAAGNASSVGAKIHGIQDALGGHDHDRRRR